MQMNGSAYSEVLRETDQVKEHRGNPGVDTAPQEVCFNEEAPPRNPVRPCAPDEGAFETFIGGEGI
jgi:hypothetical protein